MKKVIIVEFDNQYVPEIKKIRNAVFTGEQKINEHIDFDGKDQDAVHVLVRTDNKFVATGRLFNDGHIGRIAVLKEYRGKGFGVEAVTALVEKAKQAGMKRVFLASQIYVTGFYKKLGFKEYGAPFFEANIEHIYMERII
jgi:predicted GNAT family N-acyltransferase